ncbi:hypothetical protein [Neomegalonema sp.]|uniref:hypothetical protein n=1 Tax=Neomegalonema sp. TaxID=2039713 RepID=UPI00262D6122|nr:hypothetical protein [Neomegalonema sp.]MDD2869309.1 hypothetical protein [Neomegalonema sp.]
MTARLFIGASPHGLQEWGADIVRLNEFQPGEQVGLLSPMDGQDCFLQLCVAPARKGEAHPSLHPLGDPESFDLPPIRFMDGRRAALLAPIGEGSPLPREGFVLVNRQLEPFARYVPFAPKEHPLKTPPSASPDDRSASRNWPDWRFELAARGVALFIGGAENRRFPQDVVIVLGDLLSELPPGAREAWLNPLVIGFRGEAAAPGLAPLPAQEREIPRAIREAAEAGAWMLVPEMSMEARRRLVGWRAFFGRGGASPLNALFDPARGAATAAPAHADALADLAALDEIGGVFHVAADGKGPWRWTPPEPGGEKIGVAQAQLRRALLARLDLVEASADSASRLYEWRRSLQRPMIESQALEGVGSRASIVERLAGAARVPTVGRQMGAALERLAEAAGALTPEDAAAVFAPLIGEAFHDLGDDRVGTDLRAAQQTIARDFLKPRSGVRAEMTSPDLEGIERAAFESEWSGFALDLFASAGAGPDETLREISGPGGAPYEADYDSPWWSAFWRHCVAGEKGRRFLLSRRVRAFVLDSSVLDGSAFLAEDAR